MPLLLFAHIITSEDSAGGSAAGPGANAMTPSTRTPEPPFKLGREVTWNTAGKKYTDNPHMQRYQCFGIITEVVAAKALPVTYTDGNYTLGWRDHESYVVTVYGKSKRGTALKAKRYWPLVSRLSLVSPVRTPEGD